MSFQHQAQSFASQVSSEIGKSTYLQQLEAKTGIHKNYQVAGLGGFYLLMVFLNIGGIGQLFANFASVALPGYYSLAALETPGTSDDTQLLTYWVVYAAFSIVEFWSGVILYWFPLYWFFKTVVFLYLGIPRFGGAKLVYERFIRPFSSKVLGIRGGAASNLKEKTSASTSGAKF